MIFITNVTDPCSVDFFVRLLERRPTYLGLRAVVSRQGSTYGVYVESDTGASDSEITTVVMGVLFGELAMERDK